MDHCHIKQHILTLTNGQTGVFETDIPGLIAFHFDCDMPKQACLYQSSLIFIATGRKVMSFKERDIEYNADNYLVVTAPAPIECQTFASQEEPLTGLLVQIDPPLLQSVIAQLSRADRPTFTAGAPQPEVAQTSPVCDPVKGAMVRLARAACDSEAARILGKGLLKELYFYALKGPQAPALHALFDQSSAFGRIADVLSHMHQNLSAPLQVEKMAAMAHMSTPTFHRAFRSVTGESPVQFLKKARLSRARELIERQGAKAGSAAEAVGYESVSQFSREFKRLYGLSPSLLR